MNIRKLTLISLLALGAAGTHGAFAQTASHPEGAGYAGLLFGFAKPEDLSGRLGFGGEVGIRLENGPTVGAFLITSNKNFVRLHHYGLAADFNLPGPVAGARVGAMVGAATASVGPEGATASDTNIAIGPRVGFDYVVSYPLSVGADVSALWAFGDETSMTFYALASIKYWF